MSLCLTSSIDFASIIHGVQRRIVCVVNMSKNKSIEVKNGAVSVILKECFWIKIESMYVCSLRLFIPPSARCEEIMQC